MTTMGQERLSDLALLSIESEVCENLDFSDLIVPTLRTPPPPQTSSSKEKQGAPQIFLAPDPANAKSGPGEKQCWLRKTSEE
jgi:hypothetical protein